MATDITVEVEVRCECGEPVSAVWKDDRWMGARLEVEPCSKCRDASWEEGYNKGCEENA